MVRTLTKSDKAEFKSLFKKAKTVLSKPSRMQRMIWASDQFMENHPEWK